MTTLTYNEIYDAWRKAGMTKRAANVLANDGIATVEELRRKSRAELMRLPNCSHITTGEIFRWLRQHGHVDTDAVGGGPLLVEHLTDEELLNELTRRLRKD